MFRCDQNGPPARREEGAYPKAIRNRRATQPPAHFHRNPPGRGQLAVFPRCSLLTYEVKNTLVARALKNSQLTSGETYTYFGDSTLKPIVAQ